MARYEHTTVNLCPACRYPHTTRFVNEYQHNAGPAKLWCSRNHEPTLCEVTAHRTRPIDTLTVNGKYVDMLSAQSEAMGRALDREILHTPTPKEAPMATYNAHDFFTANLQDIFAPYPTRLAGPPRAKSLTQLREERFAALDVQNGDRLELVTDESKLVGKVIQVREVNGEHQVRIQGFGETPHGSHNTWFAVRNYTVARTHKAYRTTPDDRVIAALASVTEEGWAGYSEQTREDFRKAYAEQLAAVKQALSR